MASYEDLKGKVAIITGAGAAGDGIGNGRAAAILLARSGAQIVAVDRKEELAQRTVQMIEHEGGTAIAVAADVTSESDCQRVVDTTLSRFATIDLLDNNVGVGGKGSVLTESPQRWERIMKINVSSMFQMSRAVIPVMKDGGGGAIVNVSSIAAMRPHGLTAYSTSKGAVIALTKAMAVDHAPDSVRVNCVAPGPVYTPLVSEPGMSDVQRQRRIDASLLKIEGSGWDVGNAVVFLLSNAASYITGQTLVVDGGVTLSSGGDR